jgi:dienelactone hydrolase
MTRRLASVLALLGAAAVSAGQISAPGSTDAAFLDFFQARTAADIAAATERIVASGVGFDEALQRLKRGRVYSRDVPRGIVHGSYTGATGQYFYTLDVPEGYTPDRKYQVRVQLHGGVGRFEDNNPRFRSGGQLASGVEQIYVMPYAWRDAPWWSQRQAENLHAIVDLVKRTYNIDENRVVLSGVSDGGTGAFYTAMRETTPFASFAALNGFIMVLRSEIAQADGDVFPNNLLNKPLFIVNGGRDPRYPTSAVDPYVAHLAKGGVDLVYQPQPNAAHDTSWWPDVKESFEAFVTDHPRRPLPDKVTWESGPPNIPSRAHWLILDRLSSERPDSIMPQDLNRMAARRELDFGIRSSMTIINRVVSGSNADQIGLKSGDVVVSLNNQPTPTGTDVADLLRDFPPGRPLRLTVTRGGESLQLTGRFSPTVLPGEADRIFPPQRESGRVDIVRTGNKVEAITRGVGKFTLLISPDQFDLKRPITVVENSRTVFEGVVRPDIRTLLKWAARDNDRTLLFAAELPIELSR